MGLEDKGVSAYLYDDWGHFKRVICSDTFECILTQAYHTARRLMLWTIRHPARNRLQHSLSSLSALGSLQHLSHATYLSACRLP